MKRSSLETHLRRHGCQVRREGGRHTIWENPTNGAISAVPRHAEINNITARQICRDLGIPDP